jgi:hypothetical protein
MTKRRYAFPIGPWTEVPPALIVRGDDDHVGKLFLAFAVAFNDFKTVLLIERHLDELDRPPFGDVSEARGEWLGLRVHTHRLLGAMTFELIELVRSATAALLDPEAKAAVAALTPEHRARWDELVAAAPAPNRGDTGLLHTVRNKLAFHYRDLAEIAAGFRRSFELDEKSESNRVARFSMGRHVENTRFFYADAAVQSGIVNAHEAHKGAREGAADERVVRLAADRFLCVAALVSAFVAKRAQDAAVPVVVTRTTASRSHRVKRGRGRRRRRG